MSKICPQYFVPDFSDAHVLLREKPDEEDEEEDDSEEDGDDDEDHNHNDGDDEGYSP
jgi:hypothetical protein